MVRYDVNNVCNNKDTSALMKIDFYQSPISKLNNADKKTAEYEQKYSAVFYDYRIHLNL